MIKSKPTIHLLLRFSDTLLKTGDTIEAHNHVVGQHGAVWFGKMGSPVSQGYIDILNKQIEEGIPTFVYLVKGNRRKSVAYRAKAIRATKSLPDSEKSLIPPYYVDLDLMRYMKFWVKLDEIESIPASDLGKLRVASSVLPLSETLGKSATGHFFLVDDKKRY